MKLGELLEQVKVGNNEYKAQENAKAILETFDEETDKYKISQLMAILGAKLTESKNDDNINVINRIKKAANRIELLENKVEKGYGISKSYARMRLDSLREDYNIIMKELESKKVMRSFDKNVLGHSIALLMFEMSNLVEKAEISDTYSTEDLPSTLKPFVVKELKLINETIN